jgi:hypothetical protein
MLVSEHGSRRLFLLLHLHKKHLPDGRTGLDALLAMKPVGAPSDWLIGAVDQILTAAQSDFI